MLILDATASQRSIWYQKNNPFTVFMDMRQGIFSTKNENTQKSSERYRRVFPDIIAKWQYLPFKSESFDMVIFDPPHLVIKKGKKLPLMAVMYGAFYEDSWREQIRTGAAELFRALKSNGFFVLKWCENDKSVSEVLKLIPYPPMFGTRTGQANNTHWITFIKHRKDSQLEDYV